VNYTPNFNLNKPARIDPVLVDDLNENADIIDQKLKELEDGVYNAPPNSVNDAAIGSRTPDQSQAPASPGTGTLTQLVSWLANRIKAITGKTNWWDAPPTTLQAAKTHMDAAAPHSGHETPSGAQTKANAAEANAKSYTDTHAGTKNTHGVGSGYYIAKTSRSDQLPAWNDVQGKPSNFTPSAHKSTHASGGSDALTPSDIGAETPAGAQAKANAALNSAKQYTDQKVAEVNQALNTHMDATSGIHGATSSATANRLIIRDNAGRAKVAAPSESDDIARKAEVDTHAAVQASLSQLGHVNHAVLTTTIDTNWQGSTAPYTKTQTVNGLLATDTPIVDVVMSGDFGTDEARIEAWGYVYRITTANNAITLYATEKPTVSLPIQLKVVR